MVHKTQELKEFLIAARKKIGPGMTNAPVWAMRKAGKRLWNKKQKRHWRSTKLGLLFKKKQRKSGKQGRGKRAKSGKMHPKKRKMGYH
ncbi:MAG: hypothetical protein V1676_04510 [Candidatus Diapherotrites archaeon]